MQQKWLISLLLFIEMVGNAQVVSSDSLLKYEYEYFTLTDSIAKNEALLKKFDLYVQSGVSDAATIVTARRIRHSLIQGQDDHGHFLWNAALFSYLNDERDYAVFLLSEYQRTTLDTSASFLLLQFLVNKYHDTLSAGNALRQLSKHDTSFRTLSCVYKAHAYEKKNRNLYLLSSALVPGSGTMMNGYILKGLTSLALTGSAAFGIFKLVESGLYINAVLWGTGLGLKFYTGNLRLTEKTFDWSEDKTRKKISDNCENNLQQLLTRYPLSTKK